MHRPSFDTLMSIATSLSSQGPDSDRVEHRTTRLGNPSSRTNHGFPSQSIRIVQEYSCSPRSSSIHSHSPPATPERATKLQETSSPRATCRFFAPDDASFCVPDTHLRSFTWMEVKRNFIVGSMAPKREWLSLTASISTKMVKIFDSMNQVSSFTRAYSPCVSSNRRGAKQNEYFWEKHRCGVTTLTRSAFMGTSSKTKHLLQGNPSPSLAGH